METNARREDGAVRHAGEKKFVVGAVILLVAITGGSRVLGLVREAVIAAIFGAGSQTDSFFVAFSIPDFLFNSLSNFLIATSFIPVFCRCMGGKGPWEFTSSVFAVLLSLLGVIVIALEIFAPDIVTALMPSIGAEQLDLTVDMTRIMLPIIIAGALTGMAKGILNSYRNFTIPALTTIAYNVVIISSVLLLGGLFGIKALAAGVLAAAATQFMIQLPSLRRVGARLVPRPDFRNGELRSFLSNIWPVLVALSIGQAIVYFELYLASQISEGSISYLSFANRIFVMPEQVIVAAITTVIFPLLSADAAQGRRAEMAERLSRSIRFTLFLILPVSIFMAAFSTPIIETLLGRGAFTGLAAEGTGAALSAYSVGLVSISIRALLTAVFFALGHTRTLLMVTAAMVPMNMLADLELIKHFSYMGIAYGTAFTATLHVAVLIALLRKRMGALNWGPRGTFPKIFASSGATALAFYLLAAAGILSPLNGFAGGAFRLLILLSAGFAVYFGLNILFRVEEAHWVRDYIRHKWAGRRLGGLL